MKNCLLSILLIFVFSSTGLIHGQVKFEVPIQSTGGVLTDTLDDGTVITFELSTDDAEQENDAMDALYDDDLDFGWEGDPTDFNILTLGLRFRDIAIPQGAVIDSAYVIFYSHETKTVDDVANITVVGEAADHTETYDEETLITDRPETSASVSWVITDECPLWKPFNSPDLSAIIQEIVDREGWEPGNALSLMFKGEDQGPSDVENAREAESFENIADPEDVDGDGNPGDGKNHPERVPRLVIWYTAPQSVFIGAIQSTGGVLTDTLDDGTVITFELSTDDAEQENDAMDALYDDDLDFGWEGDPTDFNILTLGLRFREVTIPQGATIESATVTFYSHETKTVDDVANITVVGEAADNTETYDEETLITDRPETSASVEWIITEECPLWKPFDSPDLSEIIQEIVDRPGWASGNALSLMFKGEDQGPSDVENAREAESFENIADPEDVDGDGNPGDGKNHPERIPTLTVYYSMSTSVDRVTNRQTTFEVYPNPSNGIVYLSFPAEGHTMVNVYSLTGQMVRSFEAVSKTAAMDFSDLQKGIYIFEAKQGNYSLYQKVILK